MFGAIGDSAPDRWGRALMRRMERRRAKHEGQAPRTLHEMDYLLLVDDEARAGALPFAETEGGPFLRQEEVKRISPLVELPRRPTFSCGATPKGSIFMPRGLCFNRSAVCRIRPQRYAYGRTLQHTAKSSPG
jgi:hypothetical protein